jgi:hypothetical protein
MNINHIEELINKQVWGQKPVDSFSVMDSETKVGLSVNARTFPSQA